MKEPRMEVETIVLFCTWFCLFNLVLVSVLGF
jgi:hypothetical protein